MQEDDRQRRLRRKNYAMLGILLVLMAVFYAVALVKFAPP